MSRRFVMKISLLGSLALGVVGFSGCGGGSEPTQPTSTDLQTDAKRTQERQDLIKKQYENKAAPITAK
jgi:hypothetical protein